MSHFRFLPARINPFRPAVAAMGAVFLAALASTSPAQAQDEDVSVNQLIVYGDDECPQSTDDLIVVCVRLDEGERYRIPGPLRADPNNPANQAWTQRIRSFEVVGQSGTESCTATGAGGFTGCTNQFIQQAYAERAGGSDVQFGRLIEAARQERLSRIDAEAAAVQAEVEAREREIAEREAAQNGEPVIDDTAGPGYGSDDLIVPPPLRENDGGS